MQIIRPKMTRSTYLGLKRYIMRDREKKKQEQEQDKEQERLKKEREMKRRKEEEDNLTLEQTKEQIHQLEEKLVSLKQEKSNLFSQLKKVLHQEIDLKQRTQLREQNEQAANLQHQYLSVLNVHPQVILQQQQLQQRQKYLNIPTHNASPSRHAIKRSRSPSPTPQNYPHPFSSQFLPPNPVYSKQADALRLKPGNYPPPPPPQQQPPPAHPGLFLTQQQQQQQHNFLLQQQQQQQQNYSPSLNVQKYHPSISPANMFFSQQQSQLGYSPHQQQPPSIKQQSNNYLKSPSNNRSKQGTPYGMAQADLPLKPMYSPDDKLKSNQVLSVPGGMLPGLKAGSIVTGHPASLLQQQQLQQLPNTYNASPSAAHNQSRSGNYPPSQPGRY